MDAEKRKVNIASLVYNFSILVVYHELVLKSDENLHQVTQLKLEWLVKIAPHFYQLKDVKDSKQKRKGPAGREGLVIWYKNIAITFSVVYDLIIPTIM